MKAWIVVLSSLILSTSVFAGSEYAQIKAQCEAKVVSDLNDFMMVRSVISNNVYHEAMLQSQQCGNNAACRQTVMSRYERVLDQETRIYHNYNQTLDHCRKELAEGNLNAIVRSVFVPCLQYRLYYGQYPKNLPDLCKYKQL